jgi:hypothetical protein
MLRPKKSAKTFCFLCLFFDIFALNLTAMQLQTFQYMPIWEKVTFLHSYGEYLTERQTNAYRISLYALGDHFAEIWRHKDFNEVDYVRIFKNMDTLEPYTLQISIHSLFQSMN